MFLMAVCGIMTNIKRHLLPDAFTKLQFMEYFLMWLEWICSYLSLYLLSGILQNLLVAEKGI